MKKWEISIAITLVIAIIANFAGFAQTEKKIESQVLRLHILANSDSAEDQALKLAVRDRLLGEMGYLFENADSRESAVSAAREQLENIEAIARDEITKQGYDYGCKAEIVDMYFTIREYGDFTMPAGYYKALRISIGAAKGKNWWCVMFPPLCLPAATQKSDEYFDKAQNELIHAETPRYEVKFKTLEIIEKIRDKFRKKN